MGTQQILMVVLSVIVVGAAVAIGIVMFDNQAKNQARMALTTEITIFAAQAQAWFMKPRIMGGGEGRFEASDIYSLQRSLNNGETGEIRTPTGVYTISAGDGTTVRIVGFSLTNNNVHVTMDIDLRGGMELIDD